MNSTGLDSSFPFSWLFLFHGEPFYHRSIIMKDSSIMTKNINNEANVQ